MQKYLKIGQESVPALGFGTYMLEGKECISGVEDALRIGYRHIDTARMYKNEAEVGAGIRNSGVARDEIFLTTKVWSTDFSKSRFIPAVEDSLRQLKTEYLDLLLLHWPSSEEADKVALEQLNLCREKGYAKHIGVSNYTLAQMEWARQQAPVFCNQIEYHPFINQERMLQYLKQHKLLLTAYTPLALGKVLEDPLLNELALKYSRSETQLTLRWLIQQEVSPIPKASKEKHRRSNFEIFDFEISEEDMEAISSLRGEAVRVRNPAWAPKWDE